MGNTEYVKNAGGKRRCWINHISRLGMGESVIFEYGDEGFDVLRTRIKSVLSRHGIYADIRPVGSGVRVTRRNKKLFNGKGKVIYVDGYKNKSKLHEIARKHNVSLKDVVEQALDEYIEYYGIQCVK